MAAVRFSRVRYLHSSIKGSLNIQNVQNYHYHPNVAFNLARISSFSIDLSNRRYSKGELQSPKLFAQNQFSTRNVNGAFDSRIRFSRLCHQRSAVSLGSMTHVLSSRMYSSSLGGKGSRDGDTEVAAGSGVSDVSGGGDSVVSGDLVEKMKDTWKSVVEVASYAGEKVKEASDDLTPYAQQLLDSHPYLNMVVIPVGGTLTATLVGWFILPRILRKFHKYAMQGPVSLFPGSLSWGEPVPYEKSFWGAMEDPVRYLVTFLAFSQMLVGFLFTNLRISSWFFFIFPFGSMCYFLITCSVV